LVRLSCWALLAIHRRKRVCVCAISLCYIILCFSGTSDDSHVCYLESATIQDALARLLVLVFINPHLFECRQCSKDRATHPCRFNPVLGSVDANFGITGTNLPHAIQQPIREPLICSGSPCEKDCAVQCASDVQIACFDSVYLAARRTHLEPAMMVIYILW